MKEATGLKDFSHLTHKNDRLTFAFVTLIVCQLQSSGRLHGDWWTLFEGVYHERPFALLNSILRQSLFLFLLNVNASVQLWRAGVVEGRSCGGQELWRAGVAKWPR